MMPLTNVPRKGTGDIKCEMINETTNFHVYTEKIIDFVEDENGLR